MEDNTSFKRNEETTITSSGRPKRQQKARKYSDEFYFFDIHGKIQTPHTVSIEKVNVPPGFATSTPLKQSAVKQIRIRKAKQAELEQSDTSNVSTASEMMSPLQNETSVMEIKTSPVGKQKLSRKLSDIYAQPLENSTKEDIARKGVASTNMKNEHQSTTEIIINNGSDMCLTFKEQCNDHVDISSASNEKIQSKQSRNTSKSTLDDEEAKIVHSATSIHSHVLKHSKRKGKLDHSLAGGNHDKDCVNEESSKKKDTKINNVDKTLKKQSKQGKCSVLCIDNCLTEHASSDNERTETINYEMTMCDNENSNLHDSFTGIVNVRKNTPEEAVNSPLSTENGVEDMTHSNLLSLHKKERSKSNMFSAHGEKVNNIDVTLVVQRGRGRKSKATSDNLQTEPPMAKAANIVQKAQKCKSSLKDKPSEISVVTEQVPNSSKSIPDISKENSREMDSAANVDCQLQEVKMEQQFDTTGFPAPSTKQRPTLDVSQSRKTQQFQKTVIDPVTEVGNDSTASIDLSSHEIKKEKEPETNAAITPQKKRRGRPPKCTFQNQAINYSHQTMASDRTCAGSHSANGIDSHSLEVKDEGQSEISVSSATQRRRRGRPSLQSLQNQQRSTSPKTARTNQVSGHNTSGTNSQFEQQSVDVQDTNNTPASQRKRGRKPRVGNSENPNKLPESQRQTPGSKSYTCHHCGQKMDKSMAIQHHMMAKHSLIWSTECPEGIDNPYLVVRKLGYVACQVCGRQFRNAQYYKHHQIWCGRENEMATCEICNHTCRAMWMQQHIGAHKTQEKKLARAMVLEEQRQQTQQEQVDSEEDDAEGLAASLKSKRKAAKNAIKLMTSLRDDTEQEQVVSDASSVDGTSGDSSDDDEDDDDDDNDEDVESKHDKKTKRVSRVEHSNSDNAKSVGNIWLKACSRSSIPRGKQRRQLLKATYHDQPQEKLFPHLCPRQDDWRLVTDRQYLPVHKESGKFTFGSIDKKEMADEQHSLKFGQAMAHNGKSYCYTGGPLWAIEWCPVPEGTNACQFLAVAAVRSMDNHPDVVTQAEGPGLIQIWSAGSLTNEKNCCATPVFRYAIAHDSGYVRSISWCHRGCLDVDAAENGNLKRLGLFAVACSDGKVLIYCPAHPDDPKLGAQSEKGDQAIAIFQPPPALVLMPNSRKGCGPCLSVAWQQGTEVKYIAAGYGLGAVFLWDITSTSPLVKIDAHTLRPIRYFGFHTAGVVSISWNPVVPSVFATASLDFTYCVWNIMRPDQPIGIHKRILLHNLPRSVCWAGPIYNGFFTSCEKLTGYDNTPVCYHGLSKAVMESGQKYITVQYHSACTWDLSYCPFYDALVTCDSAGIVKLTLLSMRSIICQKTSRHKAKSLTVDLYRARPSQKVQPQAAANTVNSHDSPDCRLHTPGAEEDMLLFLDCAMTKSALQTVKKVFEDKSNMESSIEVFSGRSTNAIHKVSFSPNPGCCLWLASGGQAGILRLDNLTRLV